MDATRDTGFLHALLRTVPVGLAMALFLFPVLWLLSISVKPNDILFAQPPDLVFSPITDHFDSVLSSGSGVIAALGNSILISVASTVLVVLAGTPAAYALARLRVARRDDLMLFFLASRMAPPVALIIPFFLIYKEVGLLETELGLIIAYMTFNLSFYVWVLAIFTRDIPADLEAAGQADGYSPSYVFARIILPLMRPSIIAVAVLVFIFAWNEFAFALLLGGRGSETLPVIISRFITPSGVEFGELAAVSAIALAPILIVVLVLHRHIVRGLSLGAVKG